MQLHFLLKIKQNTNSFNKKGDKSTIEGNNFKSAVRAAVPEIQATSPPPSTK